MKTKILVGICAVLLAAAMFGAGAVFGAGSSQPGTQGDPIVSLSYLDSRLSELEKKLTGTVADNAAGTEKSLTAGTSDGTGGQAGKAFTQVKLTKGQSLILADGSVAVVYSGSGTVLGTTGLVSLSDGELFALGNSVVMYTPFLGIGASSGISASGAMTVYVMGEYEIK